MEIPFYKYQGTGNDFIMIDNRQHLFNKNDSKLVAQLCDRKFGIGADGLILLEEHPTLDFSMVYYNADGNLSSMCGNGGRCIAHLAKNLGIVSSETKFEAIDGLHSAEVHGDIVSLKMNDVKNIQITEDGVFLDTGSPHHVTIVKGLDEFPVYTEGVKVRYNIYGNAGANINFVEPLDENVFKVRTYERGVEDETLSCGTGVTAVALAMFELGKATTENITLRTPGGELKVRFKKSSNGYTDVFLEGPATFVFKGIWK